MLRVDMSSLYEGTAKIDRLDSYIGKLGGMAPVWLYLKVAHALHGRARKLWYESPALGENNRVLIFDHEPF